MVEKQICGNNSMKVNPSTPRPEGQGLLRVDPEPRFLTSSLKTGLGAAERVKNGAYGKGEDFVI